MNDYRTLVSIVAPHMWFVRRVSPRIVSVEPDEDLDPAPFPVVDATLRLAGYDMLGAASGVIYLILP